MTTLKIPELASAALHIATDEYPELNITHYHQRIHDIAAAIRPKIGHLVSLTEQLAILVRYLSEECHLRANTDDYYDPRNSFINDVLDRGLGIPVSLSIIYLSVAELLNLPLFGVGFPGHFLLGIQAKDSDAPLYIDPFHPHQTLQTADCITLFDELGVHPGHFDPAYLNPVKPKQILMRLLGNLKMLYLKQDDAERALRASNRLIAMAPEDLRERRDRAIMHMQLAAFHQAIDDIDAYLPHCTNPRERSVLVQTRQRAQARITTLN